MKIVLLSVAFILCLAVSAYTQSDSVKNETEDYNNRRPDPSKPSDVQPAIPESNSNQSVNPLIRIRIDMIPFGMKRELKAQKYRGWERSSILQNPKTLDYSIDIRSGDSIRTFSFDRTGNPID